MSGAALRVASYNIHAGVGTDGRFNPHRLIEVLLQLDADIIGLQEVVSVGTDGFALLDELAQECSMQAVAGPTMMRGDALYGNALLSRLPLTSVARLDLSVAGYEPRGALAVTIAGKAAATFVVTHLGLKRSERTIQLTKLLAWMSAMSTPIVLLGDLNEWWPWSGNRKRLAQRFHTAASPRTFPAQWPLLSLDGILATSPTLLASVCTHTRAPANTASDHLPLVASLSG